MNAEDFTNDYIRPVLSHIGLWSASAERLMLMTACHESMGFRYNRQVGGPALSFFQVEPDTLDDLYDNYLTYRPARMLACDQFSVGEHDRYWQLQNNNSYACAVARMIYLRAPEKLPDADDLKALARYAKRYWNTDLGAATPEKYLDDYMRYANEHAHRDIQDPA